MSYKAKYKSLIKKNRYLKESFVRNRNVRMLKRGILVFSRRSHSQKFKYLDNNPFLVDYLKLKNKITVLIKTQRQRSGWPKPVRSCCLTELSGLGV
ncbi:hypothetical protein BpHYR1_039647 [Brachionus plicatilis]|uniref:Uncharacterized protein n=1 Tax=Brachionus plicatilis TaxID=10195 RepID=A0A3M7S858_BRAPC|nr:hypothetical protein BpHYR1_039647 [Brachionus plicatilis]